jgi:Sulfotransferase domain
MMQTRPGIVSIASYPRSGNTWIRMFLFNLTRILDGVTEEQSIDALDQFSPWDSESEHYLNWDQQSSLPGMNTQKAALDALKYNVCVRQVAHQDIIGMNKGPVFVKTHWAFGNFFGRNSFNPSLITAAVYIVRNPLDVAVSLARQINKPIDFVIDLMARPNYFILGPSICELTGSWTQNVDSWRRAPQLGNGILILRYEDLLGDADRCFGAIAHHLFFPSPTPEQVHRAIELSSFKKLKAQEESGGYRHAPPGAERFFREGRVGQWKDTLSPRQIGQIVGVHGEQMTHYGYIPER